MLNIQLVGDRELIQRFAAMPQRIQQALLKKVTTLALKLENKVKGDKLSGQVLNVRSGNLRRSIQNLVTQTNSSTIGQVYSSGDVKYAAIHEFGGTIQIPEITARGRALASTMAGKQVFFKKVAAHTITMPQRSFMRSSLSDMKTEIVNGLRQAVREGAQER